MPNKAALLLGPLTDNLGNSQTMATFNQNISGLATADPGSIILHYDQLLIVHVPATYEGTTLIDSKIQTITFKEITTLSINGGIPASFGALTSTPAEFLYYKKHSGQWSYIPTSSNVLTIVYTVQGQKVSFDTNVYQHADIPPGTTHLTIQILSSIALAEGSVPPPAALQPPVAPIGWDTLFWNPVYVPDAPTLELRLTTKAGLGTLIPNLCSLSSGYITMKSASSTIFSAIALNTCEGKTMTFYTPLGVASEFSNLQAGATVIFSDTSDLAFATIQIEAEVVTPSLIPSGTRNLPIKLTIPTLTLKSNSAADSVAIEQCIAFAKSQAQYSVNCDIYPSSALTPKTSVEYLWMDYHKTEIQRYPFSRLLPIR